MRPRHLMALAALATFPIAQATSISYGLQGQIGLLNNPNAPTNYTGGVHLMIHSPKTWFSGSELRHTFELNAGTLPPNLLYDLDLIKHNGPWHYGAGAGTGVYYTTATVSDSPIPAILYTPLLLANAHVLAGYTVNNQTTLEGIVRLRPGDGYTFGLRVSFTP